MKIRYRFLLFILSIILAIFSVILALLPFKKFNFFIGKNVWLIIGYARGNYIYLFVGLILLFLSLLIFYNSVKVGNKKNNEYYINKITDYGEIKISKETVIGLVQHVLSKFSSIHNFKVEVDIIDGQIYIKLNGEVTPDINIPEITSKLQEKIKEYIENCTSLKVTEIKVFISKISTPIRSLR